MTAKPQERSAAGVADMAFAAFYWARLVRAVGARERSAVLLATYGAWASEAGASSIGFRMLRRFMRERGHRPFCSNGAWYADVRLRHADEQVKSTGETRSSDAVYLADIGARIDLLASELARLRALVADMVAAANPLPPEAGDAAIPAVELGGLDRCEAVDAAG